MAAKLDVKALGLALGIVWGSALFFMGLMIMFFKWGSEFIELMGTMYVGYRATWPGSIIGFFRGFIDAGIAGLLIAWLYNKFSRQ